MSGKLPAGLNGSANCLEAYLLAMFLGSPLLGCRTGGGLRDPAEQEILGWSLAQNSRVWTGVAKKSDVGCSRLRILPAAAAPAKNAASTPGPLVQSPQAIRLSQADVRQRPEATGDSARGNGVANFQRWATACSGAGNSLSRTRRNSASISSAICSGDDSQ